MKGLDGLALLGVSRQQVQRAFHEIDISQAQATVEADRERILQDIRDSGADAVRQLNDRLRLLLLLQPLSHDRDVQALRERSAGGAPWRLAPFDSWLQTPTSDPHYRALFIRGAAGSGKSCACAALLQHRTTDAGGSGDDTADETRAPEGGGASQLFDAVHFCSHSDAQRNDGHRFVRSITYQLAMRLPRLRRLLAELPTEEVQRAAALDAGAAFEALLLRPLMRLVKDDKEGDAAAAAAAAAAEAAADAADGAAASDLPPLTAAAAAAAAAGSCGWPLQPLLILVDGLDQAEGPSVYDNQVLVVVREMLTRLPGAGVRLVATARDGPSCQHIADSLDYKYQPLILSPAQLLLGGNSSDALPPSTSAAAASEPELEQWRRQQEAAVSAGKLGRGVKPETVAQELLERASTSLLHLSLMLHLLPKLNSNGGGGGVTAATLKSLPRDAAAAYGTYFQRALTRDQRKQMAPLLAALVAAQEPLTLRQVQQLGYGQQLHALLAAAPALFAIRDYRVHAAHATLSEWLASADARKALDVDLAAGHRQLAEQALGDIAAAAAAGGGSSSGSSTACSYYSLAHAATHLALSGTMATELDSLLLDLTGFWTQVYAQGAGFFVFRSLLLTHAQTNGGGGGGAGEISSPVVRDVVRWLQRDHALLSYAAPSSGPASGSSDRDDPVSALRAVVVLKQASLCPPGTTVAKAAAAQLAAVAGLAAESSEGQHSHADAEAGSAGWPAQAMTLRGHFGAVRAADIAPHRGGQLVASAGDDGTVRLFDAATGQQLAQFYGHTQRITGLSFAPDPSLLATSSADRSLRCWDTTTGRQRAQFFHHAGLTCARFCPSPAVWAASGPLLAYGTQDGKLAVCRLGRQRERLEADAAVTTTQASSVRQGKSCSPLSDLEFTPSGDLLICASEEDKLIRGYGRLLEGGCLAFTVTAFQPLRSVVVTPSGGQVVGVATDFDVLQVWDVAQLTQTMRLPCRSHVACLACSPDGRWLAGGNGDGTLSLWRLAGGEEVVRAAGHQAGLRCVRFTPDGRHLVTASDDSTLTVWEVAAFGLQ